MKLLLIVFLFQILSAQDSIGIDSMKNLIVGEWHWFKTTGGLCGQYCVEDTPEDSGITRRIEINLSDSTSIYQNDSLMGIFYYRISFSERNYINNPVIIFHNVPLDSLVFMESWPYLYAFEVDVRPDSNLSLLPVGNDGRVHLFTKNNPANKIKRIMHNQNENSIIPILVYPNPFNPSTTILFPNPNRNADIFIYDIKGKEVKRFISLKSNRVSWDASKLSAGIYQVRVKVNRRFYTKAITLIK